MLRWAADTTYYHLIIDRFATDQKRFDFGKGRHDERDLQQRMGGTINGITRSLDYFEHLGIGAILLTPFFVGKKYHGYWTTDFERVDRHFGNRQQLRQLIAGAHRRNIRVIMDLPITHCHRDWPYARHTLTCKKSPYRDWFHFDDNDAFQGFFGDSEIPELNLEAPGLRTFLKTVVDQWLGLGFDGIRFDHAKRPSASFWEHFTDYLRKRHPRVLLLGENWQESGRVGGLAPFLHGELNIPVSAALRQFMQNPGRHTIEQVMRQVALQKSMRRTGYLLPTFLDNHDMERSSELARNSHRIIALSYLVQMTLPYPPIVYYGSERAQPQSANWAEGVYERDRFFREPMDWQSGEHMSDWVRALVLFRNRYVAWFASEPTVLDTSCDQLVAYCYKKENVSIAMVVNVSQDHQCMVLPTAPVEKLIAGSGKIVQGHDGTTGLALHGHSGAILVQEGPEVNLFERNVSSSASAGVAGSG